MFLIPATILFAAVGVPNSQGLKLLVCLMGVATTGLWAYRVWYWAGLSIMDRRTALGLAGPLRAGVDFHVSDFSSRTCFSGGYNRRLTIAACRAPRLEGCRTISSPRTITTSSDILTTTQTWFGTMRTTSAHRRGAYCFSSDRGSRAPRRSGAIFASGCSRIRAVAIQSAGVGSERLRARIENAALGEPPGSPRWNRTWRAQSSHVATPAGEPACGHCRM